MDYQTPMPNINEIATAIAKAQAEITSPPKNKDVDAGKYGYSYTTLDGLIEHVRKPLTDNGLWFTQTFKGDATNRILVTTLIHASGQSISSEAPLMIQGSGIQALGGAISYMRRYCLMAILGIAQVDDDDETELLAPVETSNGKFHGPLSISELKKEMRKIPAELAGCSDMGIFTDFMNQPETKALLDQCARDLPEWWFGKDNLVNGKTIHEDGAIDAIEKKRAELEEHERNR